MIPLKSVARAALAVAFLAASSPALSDYWSDYSNAWMGEQLRRDNTERFWTDLVAKPSRPAENAAGGPRTWVARDQNPWANTYGTPMSNATTMVPRTFGVVRICTCYLPANARSWDGGPLTEADVARACRAQCN